MTLKNKILQKIMGVLMSVINPEFMQCGVINIGSVGSNSYINTELTFPTAFKTPPRVFSQVARTVVTTEGWALEATVFNNLANGTGCSINVTNRYTGALGSVYVYWVAFDVTQPLLKIGGRVLKSTAITCLQRFNSAKVGCAV